MKHPSTTSPNMANPTSSSRSFWLGCVHLVFFGLGKDKKLAWLSTTNTCGKVPTPPSAIPLTHQHLGCNSAGSKGSIWAGGEARDKREKSRHKHNRNTDSERESLEFYVLPALRVGICNTTGYMDFYKPWLLQAIKDRQLPTSKHLQRKSSSFFSQNS